MAAMSYARMGSRSSSYFNGAARLPDQELPTGSCNYQDLSIGTRAPVCGCQRFYLNGTHHSHDSTEKAWCFCGHHACFHNAFSQQQQQRGQEQAIVKSREGVGEQNETVYDARDTMEPMAQHPDISLSKAPTGLGIRAPSRSQAQSINTRVWQALNDFARDQEDGGASDTTSKLPSTAAPSVIDEVRASPSRTAQPHSQSLRAMRPPVSIPLPSVTRLNEDCSATEVATPSVAGTPDFRALASAAQAARTSPAHMMPFPRTSPSQHLEIPTQSIDLPRAQIVPRVENTDSAKMSAQSLQDLQNIIRSYSQRLEALESLSFSHVPVEDIHEQLELLDGRMLDLEQWRTEQEEQQRTSPDVAPASSIPRRRRLIPGDGESVASDTSFDSNAAAHAEAAVLATLAANAETHPRIEALEDRVADLENAALPSYSRPWEVQVVLLPWSRELRGIWFSSHEATQHSLRTTTQTSEDWNSAHSGPNSSFKSSVSGAWTTQSIEAWANDAQAWLSPKACGPSGTVFQRLASRGMVKDVSLIAPDARHIFQVINSALATSVPASQECPAEQTKQYQALMESLIPLRKVRKSSRLRFLSPAEMTTSAIWTAGFLDSSVFMKTSDGRRRLYVTTPDAYSQLAPGGSLRAWKDIRALSTCNDSSEDEPAQHVAIEACWTYHENLDQPISIHSSFASHASQWSTRSQMADVDAHGAVYPPLSPWSETRVQHQRTVSLPTSTSASVQRPLEVPLPRRVASFGTGTASKHRHDDDGVAITGGDLQALSTTKRRRISLSPDAEAERRGVNFTPRWSREPPSPFTSEATAADSTGKSQGATSSGRKGALPEGRGTTPFAYATPHSNSNYPGREVEMGMGDGDTEVGTDVLGAMSDVDVDVEHGEEEWEGVDDESTVGQGHGFGDGSASDEEEEA